MAPLIAAVGDCHGDINGVYRYLEKWENNHGLKLDGVLHVGDFGVFEESYLYSDFRFYWTKQRKAPIPTLICPGNHESFVMCQRWLQEPDRMENLHILPDGEVTEFLGVRVGAVWGNFSFRSWNNVERILTARRQHPESPKAMHVYRPSVDKLKRAGEFDVLITHDAPAGLMKAMRQPDLAIKRVLGLDDDEKAHGCPGFNELYETGHPKYHFFGHFHTYYVCQEHNPLVVCLHCFNYNPASSVWVLDFELDGARDGEPASVPLNF